MIILAVDTETTGTDFFHGCRAFLITACNGETNYYFKGEVNPYTREVYWEDEVLEEVQHLLDECDVLIFHNTQFDMRALEFIGIKIDHLWEKVEDTVLASHIFASDDSHGLKPLSYKYLHYDNYDEKDLELAIKSKRDRNAGKYAIAKEGHEHFPALKNQSWWKMDMWLAPEECLVYALRDVERTWNLWQVFRVGLTENGYWGPYKLRKRMLRICYNITKRGQRLNVGKTQAHIQRLERKIIILRKYFERKLNLYHKFNWEKPSHKKALLLTHLGLPVVARTEKGRPQLDQNAIKVYIKNYPCKELNAFKHLLKLSTELKYIKSYLVWSDEEGYIHSNLNVTGTRETRQSSSGPNQQNITGVLKLLFEPAPGFIWVDADYANIELRIWAYTIRDKQLMASFARGVSIHFMIMEILYPKEAAQYLKDPENPKLSKIYRDVKGGNFALIYGATERKADETYGYPGATRKIYKHFPGIGEYTRDMIAQCEGNKVDLQRYCIHTLFGYPLDVPTDESFKSCNYYTQGSAGIIMTKGLIAIEDNERYQDSESEMIGQIHDSCKIEIPIHKGLSTTVDSIMHSMANCVTDEFTTTPVDYKVIYNPEDKNNPHLQELLNGK